MRAIFILTAMFIAVGLIACSNQGPPFAFQDFPLVSVKVGTGPNHYVVSIIFKDGERAKVMVGSESIKVRLRDDGKNYTSFFFEQLSSKKMLGYRPIYEGGTILVPFAEDVLEWEMWLKESREFLTLPRRVLPTPKGNE